VLVPHIHYLHLSQYWLGAFVLSSDVYNMLPGALQPQLKQLMLARLADPLCELTEAILTEQVPQAPASWLRQARPPSARDLSNGVQLRWTLDVETVRAVFRHEGDERNVVELTSPESALLGGLWWCMTLRREWDSQKEGDRIGVYVMSGNGPPGGFVSFSFTVECLAGSDVLQCFLTAQQQRIASLSGWGHDDFFEIGTITGGWDDAVWAAKGLPAAGDITLMASITAVGHLSEKS
jgi:hypothetical protein